MKILLLIACVLYSALSVSGENPEMPAENGDEGVQAEQWAVTNYPSALRFYAHHNLRKLKYRNDVLMFTINSIKPKSGEMDHIKELAKRDFDSSMINEESLRMIVTICDQIQAGEEERWKHYNKYKFVKQIDSSTKDGERRLRAIIKQAQNEWNTYATSARAEIENNIQELARLLKNP